MNKSKRPHSAAYYFSQTNRYELIAFSGLALTGAALIAAALNDGRNFAEQRDGIVEAWSGGRPASVALAQNQTTGSAVGFEGTKGEESIKTHVSLWPRIGR